MTVRPARFMLGLASVVWSAGLSGCVGLRAAVSQGRPPEPLRRFQAYEALAVTPPGDQGHVVLHRDGLSARRYAFSFFPVADHRAAGEVRCLFAQTPRPEVRREWTLAFLVIPIPGWYAVYARCEGSSEMVAIWLSLDHARVNEFSRAWGALAGQRPTSPEGFQAVAEAYRRDRPTELPEDSKVFKTRAEAAIREKKFWQAADDYDRAVAAAPWWPQGRYNLALIAAEVKLYEIAIEEMERYLQLVPDAENAKKAVDKIIEWKGKAGA